MKKFFEFIIVAGVICGAVYFFTQCNIEPVGQYESSDSELTIEYTYPSETDTQTNTPTETTNETTKKTTKVETSTNSTTVETNKTTKSNMIPVDVFDITYFIPRPDQSADGLCGGSGRELIDCSMGSGGVMGSVACKKVLDNYGYSYNGKRTTIYLEVPEMPELTGYYFVDDCCSSDHVIDLYYSIPSHCPFENVGVVHNAMCYVFT